MVYAAITWSTCLLPRCSHRVVAQGAVQPPGWLLCMLQVHSHAAEAVPVAAATESPTTLSTVPAAVFACAVPLAVLVGFGLGANVSGCRQAPGTAGAALAALGGSRRGYMLLMRWVWRVLVAS